ncbi:hypothetical protein QLX08_002779 [Tetragonisca angustula]|uniref:Uncharacterized protein n=1 Tax=Tetragonisca angustula TaxID=166442 RepID=A0AAW1A9W0_9HYME
MPFGNVSEFHKGPLDFPVQPSINTEHGGIPKGKGESAEFRSGGLERGTIAVLCCTSCSFQDCSANGSQMAADGWYSEASAPPI